jgi:hypothetical protein
MTISKIRVIYALRRKWWRFNRTEFLTKLSNHLGQTLLVKETNYSHAIIDLLTLR